MSSGTNYTGPASVTWAVSANTGLARQGTLTIAGQTFTVNQAAPSTKTPFDFDGDKKTDIVMIGVNAAGGWADWAAVELSTGTARRVGSYR